MKQSCMNCKAFDDYANYCMLGNATDYKIKKVKINDLKVTHELKIYHPISKCKKPKTIKEFMDFKMDKSYKKNFEVHNV